MTASRSFSLAVLAVTILAVSSSIEARPSEHKSSPDKRWGHRPSPPSLTSYNVPTSVGTTSLPSPTGTLKAIALGQGTQNYTCTASNTTSTPAPAAIGALATLFDASPFLSLFPNPQSAMPFLNQLPEYVLWLVDIEADLHASLLSNYRIPTLGHHYFNAAGQPVFDLGATGFLVAKKIGDIPAPADACAGPPGAQNYGAVDWLALQDVGTGVSRGLNGVYRVDTAGGKAPPVCAQPGSIHMPYAALYWFYD